MPSCGTRLTILMGVTSHDEKAPERLEGAFGVDALLTLPPSRDFRDFMVAKAPLVARKVVNSWSPNK